MLHSAARNIDSDYYATQPQQDHPLGEQMRHAASHLHMALDRMETAMQHRRDTAVVNHADMDVIQRENQQLREWNATLEEDSVELQSRLRDMENKHKQVSKQVEDMSARLEALISRLARVLEA